LVRQSPTTVATRPPTNKDNGYRLLVAMEHFSRHNPCSTDGLPPENALFLWLQNASCAPVGSSRISIRPEDTVTMSKAASPGLKKAVEQLLEEHRKKTALRPCGRSGCGNNVACCRPDCPMLVNRPYGEGSTGLFSRPSLHGEKLIRDKLAERIPNAELRREAGPEQEFVFLSAKLHEEVAELHDSRFEDPAEYADVIEVLYALAARKGLSQADIEAVRLKKLEDKGGFTDGLIWKKPA
jgi:predicted house-cleaning noncanonical NTP pyrophosphatase (MazG superfamily)